MLKVLSVAMLIWVRKKPQTLVDAFQRPVGGSLEYLSIEITEPKKKQFLGKKRKNPVEVGREKKNEK